MWKVLIAGMLALGLVIVPAAVAQQAGNATIGTGSALYELPIRTLAKGLKFDATFRREISSRSDKVGDFIAAALVSDVKDSSGTVIFPAGSTAKVEIMEISGAQGDSVDGRLAMVVRSVNVGDHTFRMHPARNSVSARAHEESVTNLARQPNELETDAGVSTAPVVAAGVVGRGPDDAVIESDLVVLPGTTVTFELTEPISVMN